MKRLLIASSLLFSVTGLMACADDGMPQPDTDTFAGTISQEHAGSVSDAPLCDVETPCADGLECFWVDALETDSAVCLDSGTACDILNCGDGACLVLESYPAQLMCAGNDDGDGDGDGDGDSTGDDCTVSSDGTTDCNDGGGSGGSGGSEPGNPGNT